VRHTVIAVRRGVGNLTLVLLSGGIGDYAAYAGVGDVATVADHGLKLLFEAASVAFPGIDEGRYRG
jgi:hypothetical protein